MRVLRSGVSLLQLLVLVGCDEEATQVQVRVRGEASAQREAAEGPETAAEPETSAGPEAAAEPQAVVEPEGPPPEVATPYDEAADAARDIERALAAVRGTDERVLLVFGANWCNWCRRLEHVLRHHPDVSAALEAGFEVVHVDTGARGSGRNAAVNERYGNPTQHGLPVLVVLDAAGEMLLTQETGSLEEGDRHDPAKVLAFLERARR